MTETKNNQDANSALLSELDAINFSTSGTIDIDKYFDALEASSVSKQVNEALTVDNIVTKLTPLYLGEETITSINTAFDNMKGFLKTYNVENDVIKNSTLSDRDRMFAIGKHLNIKLRNSLENMMFTISLNRKQISLMHRAFTDELKMSGNDTLIIDNLDDNLIDLFNTGKALDQSVPSIAVELPVRTTVILYQFLARYEVKGIGEQFKTLKSIMNTIKDVNELFNAYNTLYEREKNDFLTWTTALNAFDTIGEKGGTIVQTEGIEVQTEPEGKDNKPKKTKKQ